MPTCEIVDLQPRPALVVRGRVPPEELPDFFGRAFGAVMAFLQAQGIIPSGPPFGFYPSTPADVVDVQAGFPVANPREGSGEIEAVELPGGRAVVAIHVGPYDTMEQTYDEVQAWMRERHLAPASAVWENYLTDPSSGPPESWQTEIVWPIAE